MNEEHACYIFFFTACDFVREDGGGCVLQLRSTQTFQTRMHCLHFLILNIIPWSRSNGRCTSALKIQTQLIAVHTLSLTNHSAAHDTPPDPDSHSLPDRWCFCLTNNAVCPPRGGAEREGEAPHTSGLRSTFSEAPRPRIPRVWSPSPGWDLESLPLPPPDTTLSLDEMYCEQTPLSSVLIVVLRFPFLTSSLF